MILIFEKLHSYLALEAQQVNERGYDAMRCRAFIRNVIKFIKEEKPIFMSYPKQSFKLFMKMILDDPCNQFLLDN